MYRIVLVHTELSLRQAMQAEEALTVALGADGFTGHFSVQRWRVYRDSFADRIPSADIIIAFSPHDTREQAMLQGCMREAPLHLLERLVQLHPPPANGVSVDDIVEGVRAEVLARMWRRSLITGG